MRLYGAIEKVESLDDGTVRVHGVASTETVDDQGEVVLASAMRAAIPDYMRFPAIREMHGLAAAGSALEAEVDDDGITRIVAHVVDPVAVLKVKNQVYRGFSIGGRVTERDTANRKTVTGLLLNEISLVDRPANPGAVFDMWKATGNGEAPMPEGLGTLGEALAEAIAKQAPTQKWDCGTHGHVHAKKDEAQRCMVAKAASPTEPPKAAALPQEPSLPSRWIIEEAPNNGGDPPFAGVPRTFVYGNVIGGAEPSPVAPVAEGAQSTSGRPIRLKKAADTPIGKSLMDVGRVAEIILALDWLRDSLEYEAAAEGDNSPQPGRLGSVIEELCGFLNALVGEETSEVLADSEVDDSAAVMMMASRPSAFEALAKLCAGTPSGEALAKAGAAHSAGDRMLMSSAHDSIMQLTDGAVCMAKVAGAADDMSKAGARHSAATMGHLNDAHSSLVKAGAACAGAEKTTASMNTEEPAMTGEELIKAIAAEVVKTIKPAEPPAPPAPEPVLAKVAEDPTESALVKALAPFATQLDAMQKRIEDIARQPMPPLTGGVLPRGVIEVSKRDDGQSADHTATQKSSLTPDQLSQAFHSLPMEEQVMLAIKASRANPRILQR